LDLPKDIIVRAVMKHWKILLVSLCLPLLFLAAQGYSQSSTRDPELIRDTDVADQTEKPPEEKKPKERSPRLANKNIDIGNQYLKKKNYIAAISRYLEALEYQPDSIPAREALGDAYEKNGDFSKALELYAKFINDNPNAPETSEFKAKIDRLGKKNP
jgi:tetratricopeptide (TPR) repeat protein